MSTKDGGRIAVTNKEKIDLSDWHLSLIDDLASGLDEAFDKLRDKFEAFSRDTLQDGPLQPLVLEAAAMVLQCGFDNGGAFAGLYADDDGGFVISFSMDEVGFEWSEPLAGFFEPGQWDLESWNRLRAVLQSIVARKHPDETAS